MPSASMAVSPGVAQTEKKPRYVSPYKASRVRTAKGKSKSNANYNMVSQLGPNMFEQNYANEYVSPTKASRPKGSFMEGTLSSTKKTAMKEMNKTSTIQFENQSPVRGRKLSPSKYVVPTP